MRVAIELPHSRKGPGEDWVRPRSPKTCALVSLQYGGVAPCLSWHHSLNQLGSKEKDLSKNSQPRTSAHPALGHGSTLRGWAEPSHGHLSKDPGRKAQCEA